MADLLREQIERNYRAFQEQLSSLAAIQRGKFALMRDGQIIEFFETVALLQGGS